MSYLKNIAIIGASGQSGTPILNSLLSSHKNFNVTAITRTESNSTFPPGLNIKRADYTSEGSLKSTLENQDCVIIILAATAAKDLQFTIIEAAIKAGVKYILPCEFGPDAGNKTMADGVSIIGAKRVYRDRIEQLGGTWIGIICGLWTDFGLAGNYHGVNIKARTARLYDDGNTQMSTSTLAQVGRGVAKLLELPVDKLDHFKNNFVRFRSFEVSQMEFLKAVMKVTGTNESEWEISKVPVDEAIETGREAFKNGDRRGMLDNLVGMCFKPEAGGDYSKINDNATLSLEEENLDEVVQRLVKEVESKDDKSE